MLDQPAFTRRQFVNSSVAVVSTAATVPMFISNSSLAFAPQPGAATSSRPGFPEDHILVVVELSGGNDGLNTVIPFGDDQYYRARPSIGIRKDALHVIDENAGIGLHSNMQTIAKLYEEGLAAVVQGVGYPNPNRSHFASMDIWHTADPEGAKGFGWIGRAMDHAYGASGTSGTECVCISREVPLAAQARQAKPVTFENEQLFRWMGSDINTDVAKSYDRVNRAGELKGNKPVGKDDQQAFLMRTALDAQLSSDRIRNAVRAGNTTTFPRSGLGNQLSMVAAMIRAELPTSVYYTAQGGYDTHAQQPFRHGNNLEQFSTAIAAFYRELKAIGQDKRVLTLAFSEFGRRVAQNASQGTDHGTAGPMFLFGPMVERGLLGSYPSLTKLEGGDLQYTTDFRSVYAGVLEQWFNTKNEAVLGKRFKPTQVISKKFTA